jgi:protein-disulfide isomerase
MPSIKNIFKASLVFLSLATILINIFVYLAILTSEHNEDEIIKFLMNDKDTLPRVLEKIDLIEKYNNQENISKYYVDLKSNDEFFLGNNEGKKVIIEFFDYNCGYCKRSFPELMELILNDSDIKVILKELPVLGESSILASKYSIAAQKQNKYFEMHQELINFSGQISTNDIKNISKTIGINFEQLKTDMNHDETILLIKENYRLADLIGVRGTPAFIINKKLIPGAIGKNEMVKLLKNDK